MEAYKQSSPDYSECKIRFQKAFTKILDDVQSVINSPHTRKEKKRKDTGSLWECTGYNERHFTEAQRQQEGNRHIIVGN